MYSDKNGTEFKFYLPLCTEEDDFDNIVDDDTEKEIFFDGIQVSELSLEE